MAIAIGIDQDIARLSELRRRVGYDMQTRLTYLELRQQILEQLLLVSFQISGTLAELDCEGSRAEHLASSLEDLRDTRIRRFTLIAIVGDALVGILAGGLSLAAEETASAAAAITGGTIATTFGIGAVFGATYHEFRHERNLLADIWEPRRKGSDYPAIVWRYLTLSTPGQMITPREELLAHWKREGLLSDAELALYFGAGGQYEINDLRKRVVMLEMVKAQINTMNQQLGRLLTDVLTLAPAAIGAS